MMLIIVVLSLELGNMEQNFDLNEKIAFIRYMKKIQIQDHYYSKNGKSKIRKLL